MAFRVVFAAGCITTLVFANSLSLLQVSSDMAEHADLLGTDLKAFGPDMLRGLEDELDLPRGTYTPHTKAFAHDVLQELEDELVTLARRNYKAHAETKPELKENSTAFVQGPCGNWCSVSDSWVTKCAHEEIQCNGCGPCQTPQMQSLVEWAKTKKYRRASKCLGFCGAHVDSWATKCAYERGFCHGCGECKQGSPELGKTVEPADVEQDQLLMARTANFDANHLQDALATFSDAQGKCPNGYTAVTDIDKCQKLSTSLKNASFSRTIDGSWNHARPGGCHLNIPSMQVLFNPFSAGAPNEDNRVVCALVATGLESNEEPNEKQELVDKVATALESNEEPNEKRELVDKEESLERLVVQAPSGNTASPSDKSCLVWCDAHLHSWEIKCAYPSGDCGACASCGHEAEQHAEPKLQKSATEAEFASTSKESPVANTAAKPIQEHATKVADTPLARHAENTLTVAHSEVANKEYVLSSSDGECPGGYHNIEADEGLCQASAKALGKPWNGMKSGSWAGTRPKGCFYHSGNGNVFFNPHSGGVADAHDLAVCTTVHSQPDEAEASKKVNASDHYVKAIAEDVNASAQHANASAQVNASAQDELVPSVGDDKAATNRPVNELKKSVDGAENRRGAEKVAVERPKHEKEDEPEGACSEWCESHEDTWFTKCAYPEQSCSGCWVCTEERLQQLACPDWCKKHEDSWETKCAYDNGSCFGCDACPRCPDWCIAHTDMWDTKCAYSSGECSHCGECGSAAGDAVEEGNATKLSRHGRHHHQGALPMHHRAHRRNGHKARGQSMPRHGGVEDPNASEIGHASTRRERRKAHSKDARARSKAHSKGAKEGSAQKAVFESGAGPEKEKADKPTDPLHKMMQKAKDAEHATMGKLQHMEKSISDGVTDAAGEIKTVAGGMPNAAAETAEVKESGSDEKGKSWLGWLR